MLEFDGEICDDFEDAIAETNAHFVHAGEAFDVLEAYTPDEQADLWKLRKAAIPLLMSMEGDPKPYPFIEDASVPPEELAEYVREFDGRSRSPRHVGGLLRPRRQRDAPHPPDPEPERRRRESRRCTPSPTT